MSVIKIFGLACIIGDVHYQPLFLPSAHHTHVCVCIYMYMCGIICNGFLLPSDYLQGLKLGAEEDVQLDILEVHGVDVALINLTISAKKHDTIVGYIV